jgi:hypothetical protein
LRQIAKYVPISTLLQWSVLNKLWHHELVDTTLLEQKYHMVMDGKLRDIPIHMTYCHLYLETSEVSQHSMYRLIIKKVENVESIERPWKHSMYSDEVKWKMRGVVDDIFREGSIGVEGRQKLDEYSSRHHCWAGPSGPLGREGTIGRSDNSSRDRTGREARREKNRHIKGMALSRR